MTLQSAFRDSFEALVGPLHAQRIGVAVSGGSDSMALLHLSAGCVQGTPVRLFAATVDHGLRSDAANEATYVANIAGALGISHKTLIWENWFGEGNLQAAAREARYQLLRDWANEQKLDAVLLGHTADDQVETVLMALARGSGVDGLAGMRAQKNDLFLRPLLDVKKETLKSYLKEKKVSWCEDPSNENLNFQRVKTRQLLQTFETLGLSRERLLATADHMRRAQQSLTARSASLVRRFVKPDGGGLIVNRSLFDLDKEDAHGRILAEAIRWVGRTEYRPRYSALVDMCAAVSSGNIRTLGGAKVVPEGDNVLVRREKGQCDLELQADGRVKSFCWDRVWQVSLADGSTLPRGCLIKALGSGINDIPDWKTRGITKYSLQTTPAIWQGDELVAAPIAGDSRGWSARIVADFPFFSHSH